MKSHKCPAPECRAMVPLRMLACRPHWYSIPKPLRDAIWAAYDNGRGMGSPEHKQAVAEACAWFRRDKAA